MKKEDLMREHTYLAKDKREIVRVFHVQYEEIGYDINNSSCDEIIAYDELGQNSCVPWLAIFKNGEIIARMPAEHAALICYTVGDS